MADDLKWDEGKLKYSLILPEFLELMAKVLTLGEKNHPADKDGVPSWTKVDPKRYEDALFRHFQAYRLGETLDKEMGTSHMGHIAVNAMFLFWLEGRK